MTRNTELRRLRKGYSLPAETVVPVGDYVSYETIGALNVAVPAGANGIMMQVHSDVNMPTYDDVIYWMYNSTNVPMTAADQGFNLTSTAPARDVFWFDPDVTKYFNFWLGSADVELYYRFVTSVNR